MIVFRYAIQHNEVDRINDLIADSRYNPAANNNYAIREAIYYERLDIMKSLLTDLRVDPTKFEHKMFYACIMKNRLDIMECLFTHPCIDPSRHNNRILMHAIDIGNSNADHMRLKKLPHRLSKHRHINGN